MRNYLNSGGKLLMVVETVEITFENMEFIEIPARYFTVFQVEGIRTCISRVAINAIKKCTYADSIKVELSNNIEEDISKFKHDLYNAETHQYSLFDRILSRNDITNLICNYSDGSSDLIYITWEEADDAFQNQRQHAHITTSGNLMIEIA